MFKEKNNFDYLLLCCVLILTMFGIIMIFSASSIVAQEKFSDSYFFLKKQILFTLIGLALLILFLFLDYHHLHKTIYIFLGAAFLFLVLVYVPHIGVKAGGASRWIKLGFFSFQPAELAKFSLILYLAYSLSKKKEKIKTFSIGFLPHIIIPGIMIGLILLQPDFGTALTLIMIVFVFLFAAGARISYIFSAILGSLPVFYFLVMNVDYRKKRILSFLNPWNDPQNTGFQIIQSLLGFHSGEILGVGLGEGKQKLFYLPEAHTDFIFSVVGEELGLIGVIFIILVFLLLIYRGIKISFKAPDVFGTYLAFGITTLIGLQGFINMGVVLGLLPTKGLPLPFISYGGSALLCNLILAGILLNISTQAREEP